jgi:hypothetical protein
MCSGSAMLHKLRSHTHEIASSPLCVQAQP